MEKPKINAEIAQILNDFAQLENIEASPEWQQTLMRQVGTLKQAPDVGLPMSYITTICVFFMLNSICIFNILKNTNFQSPHRIATLTVISKELLINVVPINN